MRVAYRGDVELLDILLGAGANPDLVNTVSVGPVLRRLCCFG